MNYPFKPGRHYKHSRMIAAHFEVIRVKYIGDNYCKLHIRWWSHDGQCDTGIEERNKKVDISSWLEYTNLKVGNG